MCAAWQADFHHSGCSILWRYVTSLDHAAACLKLTLVGQNDLFMILMFSPFTEKKIPALQAFVSLKGSFSFYGSASAFLFQLFIWSLSRQFDEWKRERVDKKAHKYHAVYNFANYHATVLNQLRRFKIYGMLLNGVSFILLLLPSFLIIN